MSCADRGPFSALLVSYKNGADEPSEILWAAGIGTLHIASDGCTALAALQDTFVDVVVCDGDASWSESLATARRVRALPHEVHSLVPIVVLASEAPVQKVVAARNAGVHRVIDGAVSAGRLSEELCDLLTRPRPFVRDGGYFGPIRTALMPARTAAETEAMP